MLFVIEAAVGLGEIVELAWDFEGAGEYAPEPVANPAPAVTTSRVHAFAQPGTYPAVVRVTSVRSGDPTARYARVQNLARARGVVG